MPSATTKTKSRSNTPAKSNDVSNPNNLSPTVQQAFQNALEDVHTMFILNLPPEELASSDRIFFQLEQAWWYYEDIICDEMEENETDPSQHVPVSYAAAAQKILLPRFKKLQPFCRKMFEISPLLNPLEDQFNALWAEFSMYRRKISTYGTILLNQDCTAIVLCQVYDGNSWTLPAGKVNQGEKGIEAGARETYEETGFDPDCAFGQTKIMREGVGDGNLPWNNLKEEDAIRYTEGDGSGKLRTIYVCHGVPEDFPFAPVARKEVSAVDWHDLDDLPKKSFAVNPFMKGLRRWIKKNAPQRSKTPAKRINKRDKSSSKNRAGSKAKERGSRHSTPGKSIISDEDNDLIESGLGEVGEGNRWSEDDMFRVNEKLIGRKIEYDGNPQIFATNGFGGVDPHAFRVVGGGFMNSGTNAIAAAPDQDKLQPLYRSDNADDDDGLQPFFSNGGESPWGDVVAGALTSEKDSNSGSKVKKKKKNRSNTSSPALSRDEPSLNSGSINTNACGLAILSMLRGGTPIEDRAPRTIPAVDEDDDTGDTVGPFMTDKEITNSSQQKKSSVVSDVEIPAKDTPKEETEHLLHTNVEIPAKDIPKEESEHLLHLRQWIKNLPDTKPTNIFGDFRLDVEAIMNAMQT